MNGETAMTFSDSWLWLIFVGIGLVMILAELVLGLETSLDLVFIGTAFVLGGLVTWPVQLWFVTLLVTALICVGYIVLGRKYIHNRISVTTAATNIDTVIGSRGVVISGLEKNSVGRVRVGNVKWRAKAESEIHEGEEIVVTGVTGTTLSVKKSKGGN